MYFTLAEFIHFAETTASLAICLALLIGGRCNRFQSISLLHISSVVLLFIHNLQLYFGEFVRYHYSWQVYDFANVIWQSVIIGLIILRDPTLLGKVSMFAYAVCLDVTYQEYGFADDGNRELANHIFWIRQLISVAADWIFAAAIYTNSIGNPDKEKKCQNWLKDKSTS